MNKNTNSIFAELNEILLRRNSTIAAVLENYRRAAKSYADTYQPKIAEQKTDDLMTSSRSQIKAADQTAHDEAEKEIGELRKLLQAYVTEPANMALVEQLKIAKDFDLSLSKIELEAVAAQSGGNYTLLRCLSTVARQSGYTLTYPMLESYEGDLAEIEQSFACPSLFAPEDLVHEAVICSPNKVWKGIDQGRPQAYDIALAKSRANSVSGKLQKMAERWNGAVVYELTETDDNTTVTKTDHKSAVAVDVAETSSDIEMARQMGAVQAEAHTKAAEAIERFAVK